MANWERQATQSTFNAQDAVNRAHDARAGSRTAIGSNTDGLIRGNSEFSVVGINASKIDSMRDQIRKSVSNLQTKVDQVGQDLTSSSAYRSEAIKPEVDKYIESVKEYCKALISGLLAFSDKLKDVQEAWIASTQSFASEQVSSATSGMSSYTEYYTEQK